MHGNDSGGGTGDKDDMVDSDKVQNECMMLMSPPVKLEDKPSVTSDSNGDIKGDSLCSPHKQQGWYKVHHP